MTDYYNLLGITLTADLKDITRAYRKKAKEVHPDAHPGKNQGEKDRLKKQFVELTQAYDTLSDPAKRAAYDQKNAAQTRSQAKQQGQTSTGGTRAGVNTEGFDPGDLDDMVGDIEDLLGRFGLNLKTPLEEWLETLMEWAMEVYNQVMASWEEETNRGTEAKSKHEENKTSRPRPQTENPRPESPRTKNSRPKKSGPTEAELQAELETLKKEQGK